LEYRYDAAGNTIGIVCGARFSVGRKYGPRNQLLSAGTAENPERYTTFAYQPDGSPSTIALHLDREPMVVSYKYNSQGDAIAIGDPALPFAEQLYYEQRPDGSSGYFNGRLAGVTTQFSGDSAPPPLTWNLWHDSQSQLLRASCTIPEWEVGATQQPVTYDANGNILQCTTGGVPSNYGYNLNRVLSKETGGQTSDFGYDENGAVTQVPARQLTIELDPCRGLPVSVTLGTETRASFVYGSRGQRLQRTVRQNGRTVTTRYLFGMENVPLAEVQQKDGEPEAITVFSYGPTGLTAVDTGSGVLFVLNDHQSSNRAVIDSRGAVCAGFDYLPFGQLGRTWGPRPEVLMYRYTGQEWEPQIGLYNYRCRFYDPSLGRYYAPDPLGQYPSPYLYVGNNPIASLDPSGAADWWQIGAGIGLLLVGAGLTVLTAGLFTGVEVTMGVAFAAMMTNAAVGAVIGAGIQGIVAGAQDSSWSRWGGMVGLGAATGAITGFMTGLGSAAASRVAAEAVSWTAGSLRLAFNTVGGALSGGTGASILARINGQPFTGNDFGIAFGLGGATAFLTSGGTEAVRGLASRFSGAQACCCNITPGQVARVLLGGAVGTGLGAAAGGIHNAASGQNNDGSMTMYMVLGAVSGAFTAYSRPWPPWGQVRDRLNPSIAMAPTRARAAMLAVPPS